MLKFNQVDVNMGPDSLGPFYHGSEERPLDAEESRLRECIKHGSIRRSRAERILNELDATTPFSSRVEFIECLASLCVLHPEEFRFEVLW